jgi:hypothetical protein
MAAMTSSSCCSLGEQKLLPRGPRRLLATLSVASLPCTAARLVHGNLAALLASTVPHMAISLQVAGGHCAREDDSVAPEPEGRASLFVFQLRNWALQSAHHFISFCAQ